MTSKITIPGLQYNYFDKESEQYLKTYKYSGQNNSPYYNNYISPFCGWLVENVFPRTLAPNTMTVFAFLFSLAAHAVLYIDSDVFEAPCYQPVSYILFALFNFVYHILDSSDGKQARKIGNSTPLGSVLDHGLDSISVALYAMPFLQMLGCQTWLIVPFFWQFLIGMYFMVMQEYFVHVFEIPNGGDDLIGFIQLFSIINVFIPCGLWTNLLWEQEILWIKYTIWTIVILIIIWLFVYELLICHYQKSIEAIRKQENNSIGNNIYIFLYPFYVGFLFFYLMLFTELVDTNPRLFCYFYGCNITVVLIKFLIARIARQLYNPFWNFCTVLYTIVFINTFFYDKTKQYITEAQLMRVFLLIGTLETAHLLYNIMRQGLIVLNIPSFWLTFDPHKTLIDKSKTK